MVSRLTFAQFIQLITKPMNCPQICRIFAFLALLVSCSVSDALAQNPSGATEVLDTEKQFTLVVLPILQRRCFACHGSDPADPRANLTSQATRFLANAKEFTEEQIGPKTPHVR